MNWKSELQNSLSILPLFEEPMFKYTSIGTGGPAECLVFPKTLAELRKVLLVVRRENLPLFVLGSGTNLLVKDGGIKGVVLNLSSLCADYRFSNCSVSAGAAVSLPFLARESIERGCRGLEFAAGIPGSLGGALVMNAGAYGSSLGDVVKEVQSMDLEGNLLIRSREELNFSYRWSNFQQEKNIVLGGVLQLAPGNREELKELVRKNRQARRSRQPSLPSAGSVFRNPPGLAAGKIIDELGIKGLKIGGAMVSEEHANFIVNTGGATSADVLKLIELIRKKVGAQLQIELDLEIKVVGENSRE